MASKSRTYSQTKRLGQVYTPDHIVSKILNDVGFLSPNSIRKTILDPACGDGRFLIKIVQHIITHSEFSELEKNLQYVFGWDIDKNAIKLCRKNLNQLIEPLGIKIKWNLKVVDALTQLRSRRKFDFIVGNPPYIRIQHLDVKQRKVVQTQFKFCNSGATDIFIAFIELSLKLIADEGICGFITPNSYFSTETAKTLRNFFITNRNLVQLTNYRSVSVFGKTGTYPAITIFSNKRQTDIKFEVCNQDFEYTFRVIDFNELEMNSPWQLTVQKNDLIEGVPLGDLCQISVGLTTLADQLFIFKLKNNDSIATLTNRKGENIFIEWNILKPVVKGSKLKSSNDPVTEYIIFPYVKDNNKKNKIIPELVLKTEFPLAYAYLNSIRPQLDQRDNGKPNKTAWYAFGRAQALDSSFGPKIVFSPINKAPNFIYLSDHESTLYSGYFIKCKRNISKLLDQLNSERMRDYIESCGRDFQGGYKGYNKKILEKFMITDAELFI